MNWYYGINEQQYGPVDFNTLKSLAAAGQVGPRDLVWNQSMGEKWVEARTVLELIFPESASPLASAPPMVTNNTTPATVAPVVETPMGFIENAEITRMARASLSGNWGLGIGAMLLATVLMGMAQGLLLGIGGLLTAGPFMIGFAFLFLNIARGRDREVGQIFEGFKNFGTALGAYILVGLFTFLWSLLLIIPGIIATFSYAMTYFILSDNPRLGPQEAISLSKEMMRGYKWQYFCLQFRFLGWILLSLFLTFGIGMLWVAPYMQTANAHFYEMVRRNYRPDALG